MKISQVAQQESRKTRRRKSKVRGAVYGPGPYGWYGTDSGYSGDAGGVAEGVPQPGKSSGKPISWISPERVITKYLTLNEILNSVQGIPYYNEVVKDRDAKDFSWGVTKKVLEYARELIIRPDAYKSWPPIIVVDGKLQDGAHRISTINLMQKRVQPNNPVWKNAKLKVEFGKSGNVRQGVAEGFSSSMSTEDMIAYLRQHHDNNLHPDYLNHLTSTNSKFVLKNIPSSSIKTELAGLDRAKVERYKKEDPSKAPPIVVGSDGNILDGYHRATAIKELGIPTIRAYVGVEGSLKEFAADDQGRVPPFTLYFVSNTPKGMEEDSVRSFASFDEALEHLEAMYRDDPRTQNFWWIIRDGNKQEVYSDSPGERADRARSEKKFGVLPKDKNVDEGEVIPFGRRPLTWQQVPPDVLNLANQWFWATDDDTSLDAALDREGYGSGTANLVKYITAQLQQKGWTIDYNDANDPPGEFNLILKNRNGQSVLLSIDDAQDFKGWAQGTNPPVNEKWSEKYKRSINCAHPKGFSQRAHCQGRKKNEDAVNEFAPTGGGDGDDEPDEEILRRLAAQWWNGTAQEMYKAEKTLAAMGWEIGEDEGYDQGGVFVIRVGDEHGKSYISWPHEELKSFRETIDNVGEQFWALMNSVDENFADGKKPGRKGLAKRVGVNCKQSVSKLRSIAAKSSGERQRMAHWCANMKSGKKKSNENVNEADPNFVKFMNQTLANKIDKPDTQDDVPDFYKNAPAHELDGPHGGWGNALRWTLAVIQRMTPEQRQRLALKGERGVVHWLGRLAIKLKVMPDYDTEQGQQMIELGQYHFVEEDLDEAQAWLPDTFKDPNVRTWLDVLKQGTNLREEKENSNGPARVYSVLKDFLPVAMSKLKLEKLPKIQIVHQLKSGDQPTFGTFSDGGIRLAIDGRHPIDICRTLAHELVHHKQRLDNRLNPDSGETGSEEENEANSVAGIIMRDFSREFPHHMSVV